MKGLQTNLKSVIDQTAAQQAALLVSVSKARTDFEHKLTSQSEIQKMYRDNIKLCDNQICEKQKMLIQMSMTSLHTTTNTQTQVVIGGEKRPKHFILVIDESGSMSFTKLFQNSSESIWAKATEFILDFCKSSSVGE